MLEGVGRFVNRRPKVDGKEYFQLVFYIPKEIALDSQFPFREGEAAEIKVRGNQMVVSKISQRKEGSETPAQK